MTGSKRPKRRGTTPPSGQGVWRGGGWTFRLYVAGRAPRYETARRHLEELCEEHFAGNYAIEIVDLLEHPEQARTDNVIAVPMLERVSPGPAIRIIGDLSDTNGVLIALGAVR